MTAVESCPHCHRAPKRATRCCDYCSAAFDRGISPPPSLLGLLAWHGFLVLGAGLIVAVILLLML